MIYWFIPPNVKCKLEMCKVTFDCGAHNVHTVGERSQPHMFCTSQGHGVLAWAASCWAMAGVICTLRAVKCISPGQLNNEQAENIGTLLDQLWGGQLLGFPVCCVIKASCIPECRKSRARRTKERKLLGFRHQNPEWDQQVSTCRPSCSPEQPQLWQLLLPWAPG